MPPKLKTSAQYPPPSDEDTAPSLSEAASQENPADAFSGMFDNAIPVMAPDEMPEDIKAILEENGLGEDGGSYQVYLKDISGENHNANTAAILERYANRIPHYDYVARRFGPGEYLFTFLWVAINPDNGQKKTFTKNVKFAISEKLRDIHEDYLTEQIQIRARKRRESFRNMKMKSSLEDGIDAALYGKEGEEKQESAEEMLLRMATFTKTMREALGGGPAAPQPVDWAGILSAAAPFIPPLIALFSDSGRTKMEQSMGMMKALMDMQQKSSDQTIALLSKQNGPTSSGEMMKEMMTMVMGAIDLKAALTEKEETVVDKIMGAVQGVLPLVLAAGMNKQQNGPQAQMARQYIRNDPTMQQLENPKIRSEVIRRFDATIGWEQTDALLGIAGMERPEECPREKGEQYMQGDPRNEAENAEAEVNEEQNED